MSKEASAHRKLEAAYRAKVVEALLPHVEAIFSEDTRRSQRTLVIVSLTIILLSVGIVEVGSDIEAYGVTFNVGARSTFLLIGVVAIIYLEISVLLAVFSDWSIWKLKNGIADLATREMIEELEEDSPYRRKVLGMKWDAAGEDEEAKEAREKLSEHIKLFQAKVTWFQPRLTEANAIRRLRMLLYAAFPLIFGGYAIFVATMDLRS